MKRAQAEIDSSEFSEWIAFYRLEPWGDAVADIRHGIVASLIANAHRDGKARPTPFTPDDFICWTEPDPEPASLVLFDDPNAQSEAVIGGLFGSTAVFRFDAAARRD